MKCPITELEAEQVDSYTHRIKFNGKFLFIRLTELSGLVLNSEKFKQNRYLLAGAILDGQLSDDKNHDFYFYTLTSSNFDENLSKIIYPKTPKAKLDKLFKSLYKLQKHDGEVVDFVNIATKPEFFYNHFFKSANECLYYLKELNFQQLIECTFQADSERPIDFRITFKGLNYYLELSERGDLSNKCFVAMSFDSTMNETREAIKNVISKNNFEPIIIDEQQVESFQTINDAIIAAIRSCKFCIADFTQQKDGVYFESGFAVGLNKPVIYTCQQEWFSSSHFDTNHFPHIIYDSLDELSEKLDLKIKAWIK